MSNIGKGWSPPRGPLMCAVCSCLWWHGHQTVNTLKAMPSWHGTFTAMCNQSNIKCTCMTTEVNGTACRTHTTHTTQCNFLQFPSMWFLFRSRVPIPVSNHAKQTIVFFRLQDLEPRRSEIEATGWDAVFVAASNELPNIADVCNNLTQRFYSNMLFIQSA